MARSVSNQRFSKGRAGSGSATTYHGADSHSASRWFFQKNKKLLEHRVNKTFEEILWMNDQEFRNWVIELRKAVANIWDTDGSPPTVGLDENEIIQQFEKIESFKCAH